jgi:hypothetical protein
MAITRKARKQRQNQTEVHAQFCAITAAPELDSFPPAIRRAASAVHAAYGVSPIRVRDATVMAMRERGPCVPKGLDNESSSNVTIWFTEICLMLKVLCGRNRRRLRVIQGGR